MFEIKELTLTNFRKYSKYKVSFDGGTNIIVGKNASGKTTIVEAIYCLSFLKSYKTSQDSEIVTIGESNTNIKGVFFDKGKTQNVVLSFYNGKKKVLLNGKAVNKASDYLGFCNTVIFCPEDLSLVKGAPLGRRKFLNVNIGLLNKEYYTEVLKYQKLLKSRNEMLKNQTEDKKINEEVFKIVTDGLVASAIKIIEYRGVFIQELKEHLYKEGLELTGGSEKINIIYKPNVKRKDIVKQFEEKRKQDEALKTTTVGPHRDDFSFEVNFLDASLYASQGQQRTIAISLKLALLKLIKEKGKNAILILDDVFSELDLFRQNKLLMQLKSNNQIFVTTTTIDNLSSDVINGSKIINLSKEN